MGTLNKSRCYLSGAIDYAPDLGVGWRAELIEKAHAAKLGVRFIDPCNKPTGCTQEVEDGVRLVDKYRQEGRWEEMRQFVKGFRREDLRFTDIADFLIIKVDRNVHMCGSYDELFLAERQRKPIFCIIEGGIEELPTWLFGVFHLENIFTSVDECIDHLKVLDSTPLEDLDSCWVLIGQHIDTDVDQ
jgi:hypothetical protein